MASVFRIGQSGKLMAQGADSDSSPAAYMGRLVRLIPAEVLALYQTLRGLLSDPPSVLLGWLPVFGVLLVILVRVWGTRDESNSLASVQVFGVIVSTVSFVIWVLVSGHEIVGFVLPDARFGSALMVVWVFIIPFFYKGQT
ncbi:hypothetical protein [Bradyrhizobium oligotrophicum]|uniref:hypothetical protein n=1 Tax=Bradyrhizobium oligotrophicum TaxID=44255 RepID=UPI003EBCA273